MSGWSRRVPPGWGRRKMALKPSYHLPRGRLVGGAVERRIGAWAKANVRSGCTSHRLGAGPQFTLYESNARDLARTHLHAPIASGVDPEVRRRLGMSVFLLHSGRTHVQLSALVVKGLIPEPHMSLDSGSRLTAFVLLQRGQLTSPVTV